jgi:disulfide bond formation protein DsbB
VLLLTPCELCLWERWPYRIVIALGLLATLLPRLPSRILLGLAALTLLGDVGIAGLHVGVEFGWWNSPLPECNGMLIPGAPLPLTPAHTVRPPGLSHSASAHFHGPDGFLRRPGFRIAFTGLCVA